MLDPPSGSQSESGDRMAFASTFELRLADGTRRPADADDRRPLWHPGDTIPLGARTLRVIEVRDGDVDVGREPVLVVVEDVSE